LLEYATAIMLHIHAMIQHCTNDASILFNWTWTKSSLFKVSKSKL
jgi:hypothetical protein